MAKKANPRRYARAVFEIAQEENGLDRWQADLQKMAAALTDTSLLAALESPKITLENKARFLKERLGGIDPLAMNLALLLVARSAIGLMAEIAAEYGRILNKERGIEPADVVTAVPLDDKDKAALQKRLSALTGARVELQAAVDPAILGGVVARVGGKLLDGSTRTRLAALKRDLRGRG